MRSKLCLNQQSMRGKSSLACLLRELIRLTEHDKFENAKSQCVLADVNMHCGPRLLDIGSIKCICAAAAVPEPGKRYAVQRFNKWCVKPNTDNTTRGTPKQLNPPRTRHGVFFMLPSLGFKVFYFQCFNGPPAWPAPATATAL